MAALERREACGISIDECATLDSLEEMSDAERQGRLLPVKRLFSELSAVRLPEFFGKLFRSGCPIYQIKIKTAFEVGSRVRVCDANGNFFALGEIIDTEEGSAVKSVKIFEFK
jgi:tRNA U55 pseudouridine synthase TruB